MKTDDPLKIINDTLGNCNHEIKSLVKSKKDATDVNFMVCDCSNKNRKSLLLSFGINKSLEDFYLNCQLIDSSVEGVEGRFHAGLQRRANEIPINVLVKKVVEDDCEIVLTGQSFGASIAALVALRILSSDEIFKDKKKRKKILFIGFGSPAFSDLNIKKFVEREFKKNFYFYYNANDQNLVSLIDRFLHYFISNKDLKTNNPLVMVATELVKKILNESDKDENYILDRIYSSELLEIQIENKNIVNGYQHFGNILNSNISNVQNVVEFIESSISTDTIFFSQASFLRNFYSVLINKLNTINGFRHLRKVNRRPIYYLEDFDISETMKQIDTNEQINNSYSITIFKNIIFDHEIHMKLRCKNTEFITGAEFIIEDSSTFDSDYIENSKENEILISFTIPMTCDLNKKKVRARVKSHFKILDLHLIVNLKDAKVIIKEKEKEIESMPLEILYLYAALFVNIFHSTDDEIFRSKSLRLQNIFEKIESIWNFKFENAKYTYDSKEKGKFKSNHFFENEGIFELNQSIMNNDFYECYVNINDFVREIDFGKLIYYIVPTCFKLAENQNLNFFSLNYIKYKNKLKMSICNREIRDVFLEGDCMIGVIGTTKCGKSTFIEKIADKKARASTLETKTKVTPHKLFNSVLLMDYPPFDTRDLSDKLQFYLTHKLLDHTFIIYNAIERMGTHTAQQLFELVSSYGKNNYTILLNMSDLVWDDEYAQNEEEKKKGLNNIIEEIVKYKKSIDKDLYDDKFRDKLKLTCFRNIDDLEKLDGIRKANILCGNELKQEVYKIILESIPKKKKPFVMN